MIPESKKTILKASESLSLLTNQNDIEEKTILIAMEKVSDAISKVDSVIQFLDELSTSLPNYLSDVRGERDLLVDAINNATINIEYVFDMNLNKVETEGIYAYGYVSLREQFNVDLNNSTVHLKSIFDQIISLLNQVDRKLR